MTSHTHRVRTLSVVALAALATASGAATALAFPPHSLPLLAPVGMAGGCVAWRRARSAPTALTLGILFGFSLFGSVLSWSGLFGPVAYAALVTVQATFFAPVAWSAHRLAGRGPWQWTAGVAGAWTLAEAARGHVPLGGFEWAQLGYAAAGTPVLTAAGMVGVLGVTLLGAAAGAALVVPIRSPAAAGPLVLVALVAAALAFLGARPWTEPVGELDVAVVQIDPVCVGPSVDCPDEATVKLGRLAEATRGLPEDPDLIVWGESALRASSAHAAGAQLAAALGVLPAPLLAGVVVPLGAGRFDNLNILFAHTGQVLDTYRKQHPVPFGEYVPARGLLGDVADVGRLVPRDMVRGDRPGQLSLDEVRLATVSSFEATFARLVVDAAAGTDLITVLTLHSSYQRTAVSDQFLAMAQGRAAEHQRSVVVASLTGRSAIIDPNGNVTAAGRLYSADVLTGPVTLRRGATPYSATGDLPILAAAAVLVAAVGFPPLVRNRRPLRGRPPASGRTGLRAQQQPSAQRRHAAIAALRRGGRLASTDEDPPATDSPGSHLNAHRNDRGGIPTAAERVPGAPAPVRRATAQQAATAALPPLPPRALHPCRQEGDAMTGAWRGRHAPRWAATNTVAVSPPIGAMPEEDATCRQHASRSSAWCGRAR